MGGNYAQMIQLICSCNQKAEGFVLYKCKEYRCAVGERLCVIPALSYCAIGLHSVRPPAACDYPVLLTEYAPLHKDALQ